MATITARTPAEFLAAYNAVQAMKGVEPSVLEALTEVFDDTDGLTNPAKCELYADSLNDLLEAAGYEPGGSPTPPTPPTPPKPPKAGPKKPVQAGKSGKAGKAGKPGKQGKGSKPNWVERLAEERFKIGDRVQVMAADLLPSSDAILDSRRHVVSDSDEDPAPFAGKAGEVTNTKRSLVHLVGTGDTMRWMATIKFDNGSYAALPMAVLQPTKKAAPVVREDRKLLDGMDDEQCRLLVKENDRLARASRREADFVDYKSAQAKAGKSEEEVAALTMADMDAHKKKRTLTQVAGEGSERLVHSITKHLISKSKALQGLPEPLRKLREQLEVKAAEHIAEFARKEATWVNETLLKAIKDTPAEVADFIAPSNEQTPSEPVHKESELTQLKIVTLTEKDKVLLLKTPYLSEFVAECKRLGGKWNGSLGTWDFDVRNRKMVEQACREYFGTAGEPVEVVSVKVSLLSKWAESQDSLTLFGRTLASARGRDTGAKLGDGVVLLAGRVNSGGSMKNWTTEASANTVFLVRDVPKVLFTEKVESLKEYTEKGISTQYNLEIE